MLRLSTRGRGLLAAGLSVLICGIALEQRDLVRLGVLAVSLPALAWLWLRILPVNLQVARAVEPGRVHPGTVARVSVQLSNSGRWPIGPAAMLDSMPSALGPGARFNVGAVRPGQMRRVTYAIRPQARGKWTIGPLQTRISDPFGLAQRVVTADTSASVLAYPRIEPLGTVPTGGASGSGEAKAGTVAATGVHDLAVREYRHGDDLRRVHWRSTARHGELMVRTDEQPFHRRAGVVLDARKVGHRGQGVDSSLEAAVVAAASVCRGLSDEGYRVRLTSGDGPALESIDHQLDLLATITVDADGSLRAALAQVRATTVDDGMTLAVLGELADTDLADLSAFVAAARPLHRPLAILVATEDWEPASADRLRTRRERAIEVLEQSGWACSTLHRGARLADTWAQLHPSGASRMVVTR